MRYAIVVMEGAADRPIDARDGLTPLEAAAKPRIDALSRRARVGAAVTGAEHSAGAADASLLSILGYDPLAFGAPGSAHDAAAVGADLAPSDLALRLFFLNAGGPGDADEGAVRGVPADKPDPAETRALLDADLAAWRSRAPDLAAQLDLTPLPAGGALLIDRSGRPAPDLSIPAPWGIIGDQWMRRPARGRRAAEINRLVEIAAAALEASEINAARAEAGLATLNLAWLWAPAHALHPPSFESLHGLRAAVVAGADPAIGLGRLIGLDRVAAPGATGALDTDFAAKGEAAAGALQRYTLVVTHVRAPAEASLRGDFSAKVDAIESIDEKIVGPIIDALESDGPLGEDAPGARPESGARLLIVATPEVATETAGPVGGPTPFLMAGSWVRSVVERRLSERDAAQSDLVVNPGHELMEFFLRSGLTVATVPRTARATRPETARGR